MNLEEVALSELTPHPKNYRVHPDDQLDELIASVKEHGFYRNIVIARDNTILAGHGIVQAVTKMGWTHIPCKRMDIDPNSTQAIKLVVGDNEVEHLAVVDDRKLTELLKGIKDVSIEELVGTGFDESMLANLVFVTRPADEIQDHNEAEHWVGLPEWEPEPDIYKLVINFPTDGNRAFFLKIIKEQLGVETVKNFNGKTATTWYPERPREDVSSIRFEDDDE